MPRSPQRFTQREITRAAKGLVALGISPENIQIEIGQDGRLIVTVRPNASGNTIGQPNEWDGADD